MRRWIWLVTAFVVPVVAAVAVQSATTLRHTHGSYNVAPAIIDNTTWFDANTLLMFVTNTGSFAYDRAAELGKNDGLYFPKGTDLTVIFAGGVWLGCQVDGGIRVAAAEYADDFSPGPMKDGSFQTDRGSFRVYKVNSGDTRESNNDYRDWPFDDGAPAVTDDNGDLVLDDDGNRIPFILGDQALWGVYNDANPAGRRSSPGLGSAGPIGVEVQTYAWGYARKGALGQTVFMRFTIINKGGNQLDSMYVSLWADPDLGDAGDDFVGSDVPRSLGYCYNDGDDSKYGSTPPAVGYDFFQGPIVPSPGDSAWISSKGTYIQGYRNLPMTSFNKYINGTDPNNNVETYNYMRGLDRGGAIQIDPTTGEATNFMLSGNPVDGTGWNDANSSDRRWMMSSGPFEMAPGDTQEVVAAVIVGRGANRLESIDVLRRLDDIAQLTFDANFDIPGPPPPPSVWAVPHDGAIQLLWGTEADGNVQETFGPVDTATGESEVIQSFVMEGFNVYQGASAAGPWTKLATFDEDNDVVLLYSDIDNPDGKERVVVQKGSNSGLVHDMWITQDRILGGSLSNNRPYFFAVTSYNYDEINQTDFEIGGSSFGTISETFENLATSQAVTVTPRSMTGILADTADHLTGLSDGSVLIDIFDQALVTGDTYEVTFNEDNTWNLTNTSRNITELENQPPGISSRSVDGMVLRILGPPPGMKDWDIPSGTRRFTWAGGAAGFAWEGFEGAIGWGGPGDSHGFNPDRNPVPAPSLVNVELRLAAVDVDGNFDPADENVSYGYRYLRGAGPPALPEFEEFILDPESGSYGFQEFAKNVPLAAWDVDSDPPRRLAVGFLENNVEGGLVDGQWWPGFFGDYDNTASSGPREWLWIYLDDYQETPKPEYTGNAINDSMPIMWWLTVARRAEVAWETGDQFLIIANHVNSAADVFEFTTHLPGEVDGTAVAESVENVHPVPNPYYNVTSLEVDQFDRQIKFVNLPAAKTTIRIFNLAGDLVRILVKDEAGSAELVWDTETETGLPLASGLYIYHVEAEGIGTKIGKMAVFTEVEQLDTF